ncbi:MAG: hypothetical protein HGA78_03430 [Nitrospirales bacterium]|nr:hypothetical protein [Nitrospirales bacterium]
MTGEQRVIDSAGGFSLVELLILMGILAVLAVAAIPALQGYASNGNLRSVAQDLTGDIYLCKARAIAENKQYKISVNISSNTYTIEQPPGTVIQTKTPTTFGNDLIIFAHNNTCSNTANTSLTFQPRGTVDPDTVCIRNGRGSTAMVTTNITGRASVQFSMQ